MQLAPVGYLFCELWGFNFNKSRSNSHHETFMIIKCYSSRAYKKNQKYHKTFSFYYTFHFEISKSSDSTKKLWLVSSQIVDIHLWLKYVILTNGIPVLISIYPSIHHTPKQIIHYVSKSLWKIKRCFGSWLYLKWLRYLSIIS